MAATCPDCGERVYNLGCVNCNEVAYIEEQDRLNDLYGSDDGLSPVAGEAQSESPGRMVNERRSESEN